MTTRNQVITLSDGVIYDKFIGYSCLKSGRWKPVCDKRAKSVQRSGSTIAYRESAEAL